MFQGLVPISRQEGANGDCEGERRFRRGLTDRIRNAPSSLFQEFEVVDKLPDLHAQVHTLNTVQALICVLPFQMRVQFLIAFLQFHDPIVFVFLKLESEIDLVFLDAGVHFQ